MEVADGLSQLVMMCCLFVRESRNDEDALSDHFVIERWGSGFNLTYLFRTLRMWSRILFAEGLKLHELSSFVFQMIVI